MSFDLSFLNPSTSSEKATTTAPSTASKPLFSTNAKKGRIAAMARYFSKEQERVTSTTTVATNSLATASATNSSTHSAQRGAKRQAVTSSTGTVPSGFVVTKNVFNLRKPPAVLPQEALERQRRQEESRKLYSSRPLPPLPTAKTKTATVTQTAATTTVTPKASTSSKVQALTLSLTAERSSRTTSRTFLRATRRINQDTLDRMEIIRFGKPSKKETAEVAKVEETTNKAETDSKNENIELTHPKRAVVAKRRRAGKKLEFKA